MSPDLFKQIVDLLTPHLESESTRRALLDKALGVDERAARLKNQLNFSGSTDAFTTQLVRKLIQSGNRSALISVLREAQASTGVEHTQQIEKVINHIEKTQAGRKPERNGLRIRPIIAGFVAFVAFGASVAAIFSVLPEHIRNDFWITVGLVQPSPTPTATLTPSVTASPLPDTPTPTPSLTLTATATQTQEPIFTATATRTPVPSNTPLPSPLPTDFATQIPATVQQVPDYPCDAQVDPFAEAMRLDVVR
ncbi:MAG: hypothetical protein AAF653_07375, partial [Chloroflexota bacterium]